MLGRFSGNSMKSVDFNIQPIVKAWNEIAIWNCSFFCTCSLCATLEMNVLAFLYYLFCGSSLIAFVWRRSKITNQNNNIECIHNHGYSREARMHMYKLNLLVFLGETCTCRNQNAPE